MKLSVKLSEIIDPETVSIDQAEAVRQVIHTIYQNAMYIDLKIAINPEVSAIDAFTCLLDLLRDLDTDSLYLCEDILEEMMDKEDEGGIV